MTIFEKRKDEHFISTDSTQLNWVLIHSFLSKNTDWRDGISLDDLKADLNDSLCFGLYFGDAQIGFASVTTDFTSFAYLTDVFVLEKHRGKGLAKWLLKAVMAHPDLQEGIDWMLSTDEAQGLYEKIGFSVSGKDGKQMVRSSFK